MTKTDRNTTTISIPNGSSSKVSFTYAISAPLSISILQQVSLLDDEFQTYINREFLKAAVSVKNVASFLGASSAYCNPKDTNHNCAVASSSFILLQSSYTSHKNSSVVDKNSVLSRCMSFPLLSQQFQYAVFERMNEYMKKRADTSVQLTLVTPMITSTKVIIQLTNDQQSHFTTFMSQRDIQWLESCVTEFIHQYITNSGVVSSIAPSTTFAIVMNETFALNQWMYEFPDLTSPVSTDNTTSFERLYIDLFVAGQYDPLLQNISNFDSAIQELFRGKGSILLQKLTQPSASFYYGQNSTLTRPSFFRHTRSIKLITQACLDTGIVVQESSSGSILLVILSFTFIGIGSVFLFYSCALWYKHRNGLDPLKKTDSDAVTNVSNFSSDACPPPRSSSPELNRDTLNSVDIDLAEEINDDENQPLSPKEQAVETPKKNRWAFSDVMHRVSSEKNTRSPKPSKRETPLSLLPRRGAASGSSHLRSRAKHHLTPGTQQAVSPRIGETQLKLEFDENDK